MDTLDERRKQTMLQWPIFLLQRAEINSPYWKTDRVFLDSSEALDYVRSRIYDYGTKDKDWRIYGVPAAGELRNRLECPEMEKFKYLVIDVDENIIPTAIWRNLNEIGAESWELVNIAMDWNARPICGKAMFKKKIQEAPNTKCEYQHGSRSWNSWYEGWAAAMLVNKQQESLPRRQA